MVTINQVFQVKRQVPLEGLYLGERLTKLALLKDCEMPLSLIAKQHNRFVTQSMLRATN